MKLIGTFTYGADSAKVYRNAEYNEYVVRLFHNGRENEQAAYHTDDKADAEGTARAMIGMENPK